MKDAGYAHMGVGHAAGKGKAEEAARAAVTSPLMETSINGARGVLVNITGSIDIDLDDVEIAASLVAQAAHPDANIIFGASFDEDMEDEISVVVIATRFDNLPTAGGNAAAAGGLAGLSGRNALSGSGGLTGTSNLAGTGTIGTAGSQAFSDAYISKKVDDALGAEPEVAPPPPAPPPEEEDPFDTIFKIFNSK